MAACETCEGTGRRSKDPMVLHPCGTCKGSGQKQLACPWGGCNGTGPSGGSCYRCGTLVDFPYSRRDYGRVSDPADEKK